MFEGIAGVAKGLGTTLKVFFRKKNTITYPAHKKQRSARYHGRHELRTYENGLEMCVGCELCQVACPANVITVLAAENDPNNPHSPGERYGYKYQVDLLRCIFCGMCEDACPTDCLHLTQDFELATWTREESILQKDRLVNRKPSGFKVPMNVYPPFEGRKVVKA
ncbi:MAG TPA: NADH-quinone oxidoreductase subunit NuoI [Symbiobacteriaceae bacterium]|jgi:NADH-quinone oxidoreductase subunit I|nr:NADH-quinone oxidoreductase subunit NuoI [Symbiobacteriaceae bacterium]